MTDRQTELEPLTEAQIKELETICQKAWKEPETFPEQNYWQPHYANIAMRELWRFSKQLIEGAHAQAAPSKSDERPQVTIFWSEEDKGFIALAPDLPGCSAFGETWIEAVTELKDAAIAWAQAKCAAAPTPTESRDDIRDRGIGEHIDLPMSQAMALNNYLATESREGDAEGWLATEMREIDKDVARWPDGIKQSFDSLSKGDVGGGGRVPCLAEPCDCDDQSTCVYATPSPLEEGLMKELDDLANEYGRVNSWPKSLILKAKTELQRLTKKLEDERTLAANIVGQYEQHEAKICAQLTEANADRDVAKMEARNNFDCWENTQNRLNKKLEDERVLAAQIVGQYEKEAITLHAERDALRAALPRLVDLTWGRAMEDESVPSSKIVQELITAVLSPRTQSEEGK